MDKVVKIVFVLLLNFVLIQSGTKDPANTSNCQQQTGAAAAQSNTACQAKDTTKSGACNAAAPTVSQLASEPCGSKKKKRHNFYFNPPTTTCITTTTTTTTTTTLPPRCYYSYVSKSIGQTVCVSPRLLNGLLGGDIQYQLGLDLLKPCKVNGEQLCFGEYGFVTCKNGKWSVSALCDPEFSCASYTEVVPVVQSPYFFSKPCNTTIQKAKCASSTTPLPSTTKPTTTAAAPTQNPTLLGLNPSNILNVNDIFKYILG